MRYLKALACTLCLFAPGAFALDTSLVSIGTGDTSGVYYPAGGAICQLINQDTTEHGVRCSVATTGGSVYNVNGIRTGELELGIVQSDVQYNAYHGVGAFGDIGPYEKLRAVFSLYPEPFTVVAGSGSGIHGFDDLEDKRVNIGNPGSGQRATLETLLAEKGRDTDMFALASELKASEMSRLLCENRLDAYTYVVGHPSDAIRDVIAECDAHLVNVNDEAVEHLLSRYPFYSVTTIPAGTYPDISEDVTTFGVRATLVTSADVSADVVYRLVKAVFEHFDQFQRLHPAFRNLTKEEMVKQALSAPLHEGARRYYEEAGFL
ncbi:TAXI family TRAP transporter solute-binding subunit [Halomonas sp. WWR20]